jgi:hypothetical protein
MDKGNSAVTDISRNILMGRWKEVVIGVLTFLLASTLWWVVGDIASSHQKLASIPDPAQIVTNTYVDQRLSEEDRKIDTNAEVEHESLVRIENKLDTLMLSMATRRRVDAESRQGAEPMVDQSHPPVDRTLQIFSAHK